MPRATLGAQLEALEKLISLSEANIASHLAMIGRERRDGINPRTSEATLAILRLTLAQQERDRDKLRGELATLPQSQPSAGMSDGKADTDSPPIIEP
jgi:hypothetical protein